MRDKSQKSHGKTTSTRDQQQQKKIEKEWKWRRRVIK
jgi:hypothetical protein